MSPPQPTVYVIDDDTHVRESVGNLCRSIGLATKLFGSTEEFDGTCVEDGPSCLVLDVRFPGTAPTGLELQRSLAQAGIAIPIVFISGHADVRTSVEAMKNGAVEFLSKPFRDQELLDAIRHGLARDRARLERERVLDEMRQRVAALTAREQEIMRLMTEGLLGKQIAAKLRVSEVTVKVHRARMMRKLNVRSPFEMVRLVDSVLESESRNQRVRSKRLASN
jgi:FixJ family two-component response regulator